ncbi:hypothetical protein C8J27_11722 [Rhodobacter aestuarii]|uniref:Uncharacterized protein n=1 Tax=Rhodobacter aestuarii TaxID=453582 RepID=A0A1N7QGI0_9RHOB|nr:hypothetical protein [Rhodobacter aestuarii]PTV93407.1 hypothetical protein C8J27_11722 [Rhodobacter aestuarii]SIT22021.1 hypothetical protein SAMN05421580_1195 [Rhodobacter aestuarii]
MKIKTDLTIQHDLAIEAVLTSSNDPERIATRIGGMITLYFLNGWEKKAAGGRTS